MNCDLVFEILTRGPFPAGQPSDATVELHLLSCYECRQLAEALRPATSLFHEAIDDDLDAADLPGYHGELPVMTARPSAVAAAVEAAIQQIAQETQQEQAKPRVEVVVHRKSLWQKPQWASLPVSLALLTLAVVAALLAGYSMGDVAHERPLNIVSSTASHGSNWNTVMASLPLSCQKPDSQVDSLAGSFEHASLAMLSQCCQCHINQPGPATSLMLADHSAGLCLACHTN